MTCAFSLQEFGQACGGEIRSNENPSNVILSGLAIDSRAVKSGDLFTAISGKRVDGHDFVAMANDNGAVAALVQMPVDVDIPQVIVADIEMALATFGRLTRLAYDGVLIGITGSAGKTTAKNLIAAALKKVGNVLATEGNRNNELGVPLTLASLESTTEFAVLEMGAGKPRDIAYLSAIARPTVAVLLNVAEAHIEYFGSVDAIADTKSAILEGLSSSDLAVINGDQHWVDGWRGQATPATVVTFGLSKNNDYRATAIELDGFEGSTFIIESPRGEFELVLRLPGRQGVMNALAAFAVADSLGVSPHVIAKGLYSVQPAPGRGKVSHLDNGVVLVDDSYNANPLAVMAAIDVLGTVSSPRVLVLGAMLELGERSADLHARVGVYAGENGIDELWVVGELAQSAADAFGDGARWFASCDEIMAFVEPFSEGTTVLIKASNSAGFDRLVDDWTQRGQRIC